MADRSSTKKIQRVQRAGVSRSAGQRRNLAFPVAVAVILIAGSVLVFLARDARINKDGERPVLGKDVWTSAFGTYVCGEYGDILTDVEGSDAAQLGIHSHNDGLIAIHPTDESVAGDNARLGAFFDAVGISVTDDSWTQPGAEGADVTHSAGDTCGTGDDETDQTVVRLLEWIPQAGDKTDPKVYETDFADVRLAESGQTFLLALVPADMDLNDVDLPPSSNSIDSPNPEPGLVGADPTATDPTATDPAATVPGGDTPEESVPVEGTESIPLPGDPATDDPTATDPSSDGTPAVDGETPATTAAN